MSSKAKRFKFEVTVERDTIAHDLAEQSLTYTRSDRDMLYYRGTLAQKNIYDQLLLDYAAEIRKERKRLLRQYKLGI